MSQQAEAFIKHVDSIGLEVNTLMHDRDTKFTVVVDKIFEAADVEIKVTAYRSPNTNAFIERLR